jgi:hypothetical protein
MAGVGLTRAVAAEAAHAFVVVVDLEKEKSVPDDGSLIAIVEMLEGDLHFP